MIFSNDFAQLPNNLFDFFFSHPILPSNCTIYLHLVKAFVDLVPFCKIIEINQFIGGKVVFILTIGSLDPVSIP